MSDSESDAIIGDDDVNANDALKTIASIAQQRRNALNKSDKYAFGFENIPGLCTSRSKRKQSQSTALVANKRVKSASKSKSTVISNNSNGENVVSASGKNTAAVGNDHDRIGEDTNKDAPLKLWNGRKNSKTQYLSDYFNVSSSKDNKLTAVCKLCETSLSITVGNNSNLLKHLNTVS